MKAFGEFILTILLAFVCLLVAAWGYQVFWNDVILNIWQTYAQNDVLTTYKVGYGVCCVIALGVNMIHTSKSENKSVPASEAIGFIMTKVVSKLIMIGFTLLAVSFVF